MRIRCYSASSPQGGSINGSPAHSGNPVDCGDLFFHSNYSEKVGAFSVQHQPLHTKFYVFPLFSQLSTLASLVKSVVLCVFPRAGRRGVDIGHFLKRWVLYKVLSPSYMEHTVGIDGTWGRDACCFRTAVVKRCCIDGILLFFLSADRCVFWHGTGRAV